jgi:alpha-D-ribose 1-methylphosphonate 5-triphosphate diphosphatase PhnM
MKMWLTNAKIWDGVSDALLVANAIEIVDGRIVQLAASSNASGEMQDCAGLTLIPG